MAGLTAAWVRLAPLTTAILAVVWGIRLVALLSEAVTMPGAIGIDRTAVTEGAERWLATGSPFLERQLGGPYSQTGWNGNDHGEFLYPPLTLPLFLLFARLPEPAWWLVPLILSVAALWRRPPARWSWPLLVLLMMMWWSQTMMIQGNPAIWLAPVILWAPRIGWPGPLVLLKPTLLPFAVLGINRRAWWVALAILAVVAIPFGSLWAQWIDVVLDTRQPYGLAYSVGQVPFLLASVLAWYAGLERVTEPDAEAPVSQADRVPSSQAAVRQ